MRKLLAALLLLSSFAFAQTTCVNCPGGAAGGVTSQANGGTGTTGLVQGADNSIFTSAVDGSGNPNFLTSSTLTLTINGGTTALVMYIGGLQQTLVSNVSPAALAANTTYFVFAKQDTSTPSAMVAADFVTANTAPFYQYTAPTCPSPGTALSATNPSFWFDLSTNTMKACTANAGAYSASPAILLGVVVTNGSAIQAVLPEPYRMTPQRRFELFGDGSTGALASTGAATIDGFRQYQNLSCSGCTLTPTQATTTSQVPLVIYSQTPVIITNSGTINANGKGRAGGTGTTTTCGASGNGGFGGGGGGGGGGTGNAGCAGSSRTSSLGFALTGGGGTAGTAGSGVGGAGASANGSTVSLRGDLANALAAGIAPGGGSGGGDGSNAGGNGGAGGGLIIVRAPSVLVDTSCSVAANGVNGVNAATGNAGGGGGGGGGTAVIQAGFVTLTGTNTATAGSAGSGIGTGGAGGAGGTGVAAVVRLF